MRIKRNQKGMTLLEIMVAFTIVTGSFISILQAFPMGLSLNKRSEMASVASYLAQEKIEELWSLGYEDTATGTVESKHPLGEGPDDYLYQFQRETVVNYVDDSLAATSSDAGMKRISTTIYYIDALDKNEKSYNITTLISQR